MDTFGGRAGKMLGYTLWLEGFRRLRKYAKAEEHTFVPVKYVTKDGYPLGDWVKKQREAKKLGVLSKKREQKLQTLKGWVWRVNEEKWIKGFKCLCRYVEREGDAIVPHRYTQKDGYKLGLWVMTQQQSYRQKMLPKRRQNALEQLPGWVWNAQKYRHKGMWLKSWERLFEYVDSEGHAKVPFDYITKDGYKLGSWVVVQRHAHREGKLSTEQQQTLEKLPGWVWGAGKDSFEYISEAWLMGLV